jgi:hypothetical protein
MEQIVTREVKKKYGINASEELMGGNQRLAAKSYYDQPRPQGFSNHKGHGRFNTIAEAEELNEDELNLDAPMFGKSSGDVSYTTGHQYAK